MQLLSPCLFRTKESDKLSDAEFCCVWWTWAVIVLPSEECLFNPYPANVENTVFQYTRISNKMQHHTVYLYLETALLFSGGTSTHHQERI